MKKTNYFAPKLRSCDISPMGGVLCASLEYGDKNQAGTDLNVGEDIEV